MYAIADLIAKEIQADFQREAIQTRLALQASYPSRLDRIEAWVIALPKKLAFWRHPSQGIVSPASNHHNGA